MLRGAIRHPVSLCPCSGPASWTMKLVRDDAILNALVFLPGNDAALDQIRLCRIGPKADDALRPDNRHAVDPEECGEAGGVDIDRQICIGGKRVRKRNCRQKKQGNEGGCRGFHQKPSFS